MGWVDAGGPEGSGGRKRGVLRLRGNALGLRRDGRRSGGRCRAGRAEPGRTGTRPAIGPRPRPCRDGGGLQRRDARRPRSGGPGTRIGRPRFGDGRFGGDVGGVVLGRGGWVRHRRRGHGIGGGFGGGTVPLRVRGSGRLRGRRCGGRRRGIRIRGAGCGRSRSAGHRGRRSRDADARVGGTRHGSGDRGVRGRRAVPAGLRSRPPGRRGRDGGTGTRLREGLPAAGRRRGGGAGSAVPGRWSSGRWQRRRRARRHRAARQAARPRGAAAGTAVEGTPVERHTCRRHGGRRRWCPGCGGGRDSAPRSARRRPARRSPPDGRADPTTPWVRWRRCAPVGAARSRAGTESPPRARAVERRGRGWPRSGGARSLPSPGT